MHAIRKLAKATGLELADQWIRLDYKLTWYESVIEAISKQSSDIEEEMKKRGFPMPCTKLWELARDNGLIYDRDGKGPV